MDKLSLAKYFAGRVENIAYSKKMQKGALNVRNDGALSKQELSTAINSGKLSANEKNLALWLRNNFGTVDKLTPRGTATPNSITQSGPTNGKLSHQELVGGMADRRAAALWQNVNIGMGITGTSGGIGNTINTKG